MTRPQGSVPPLGFDFTAAMRRLCEDVVARLSELAHIDVARVAIGFNQARKACDHGLQASVTPMRFEGGALQMQQDGRRYTAERYFNPVGEEYLYLLTFYLPRFLNHSLEEKLETLLHELWHIGPAFDGDLRRHAGRYYAHGPSQRDFDTIARRLAQHWLACSPPTGVYTFLERSFGELVQQYGGVFGQRFATPKLLPLGS